LAKAIGLYRIIGGISKNKEKEYRKKYNLDKGTFKEWKTNKTIKSSEHSNRPFTSDNQKSPLSQIVQNAQKLPDAGYNAAINITCNRNNQKWCLDQKFTQNKVWQNRKHYQRCCNFNTAMKRSTIILENVGNLPASIHSKQLQHTSLEAMNNGINYNSMMTLFEKCKQPLGTPAAQAIIIKKQQKILDQHKLVCRIII